MPRFIYSAKLEPQEIKQGRIEAESEQDAINKLSKMGYFPLSVKSEDLALDSKNSLSFKKISNKDITLFTQQLSSLIESGVNIINALNIIAKQTPNKLLRVVLAEISAKIKDGRALSSSLADFPYLFSNLYTSMIYTGEAGGSLEQVLKRLALFMEKEEEFKDSIRAALTYPAFVFIVGMLTVGVLMGFVIPRLVGMFEDMGQALPIPTQILISLSGAMRSFWWIFLLIAAITVFLLKRASLIPHVRLRWDRLRLKIPVWGEITLKTEMARLMRTLSLLLSSGLTIVYSLDIVSSSVKNSALRLETQKFKEQISNGASFSGCLKESKLVPEFVMNIITVGEEAGTLEKSLIGIADDYERDVDRALKTMARLLEPAIILVMGLIVGFIVLSMLLPIFQINLIVK
jgi:type II secretory pathway component PulF